MILKIESEMLILHGFLLSALSGALGGTIPGMLQGPFQSLSDVWYAEIGYKTELLRRKAEEKNKLQINAYADDIVSEVTSIPESSVKEPDYSIAGPALEASTYYVNNEIIRKMFAKLVSSSVDERKDGITRSAFVEFVKQMTSVDARILESFAPDKSIPLASLKISLRTAAQLPFKSEVLPLDFEQDSKIRKQLPSSIVNLNRLGLIKYSYTVPLRSYEYDIEFKKTPEYDELVQKLKKAKSISYQHQSETVKLDESIESSIKELLSASPQITPGFAELTNLGKDFISVCL